eukprot:304939-Heterocapsa_arctica.AAC.1
MIGGKRAVVANYNVMSKVCAYALRGATARVLIIDFGPTCVLQACLRSVFFHGLLDDNVSGTRRGDPQ